MKDSSLPLARRVLSQQADALNMLAARLDSAFDEALACLLNIEGRIAVTGMGKSGHVAAKVAAGVSANRGRPAENGAAASGASGARFDVEHSTKEQRMALIRRAANGERIEF